MNEKLVQLKKYFAKDDDYKKTFSTDHGQRVLHDLMKSAFMLHTTFNPGSLNPVEMAFREGNRNIVLVILTKLNKTNEQLRLMMEQALKEKNDGNSINDRT